MTSATEAPAPVTYGSLVYVVITLVVLLITWFLQSISRLSKDSAQ